MYDTYTDYESFGESAARGEGALAIVFGIYFLFLLLSFFVSVLTYVLQSLGLYGMSKKLGLSNPWLAWIPVGNLWCIGSIAEKSNLYDGKPKGSWRILLPCFAAGILLCYPLLLIVAVLIGISSGMSGEPEALVLGILLLVFLICVAAIALSVCNYIAIYKVYKLFAPDNAVLYLVLSIFIGMSQPILFFILRNRYPGGGKTPPSQDGGAGFGTQPPNGQPYGGYPSTPPQTPYWEQAPSPAPDTPPTPGYTPPQNPDGQ